jgi:hypothetical protein
MYSTNSVVLELSLQSFWFLSLEISHRASWIDGQAKKKVYNTHVGITDSDIFESSSFLEFLNKIL